MRFNKFTLLTAVLVLMVLSLSFLIPSGAITEEALWAYDEMTCKETEESWDEEASVRPRAVLASAVFSDMLPVSNCTVLDTDLFSGGSTPIEANFAEVPYLGQFMKQSDLEGVTDFYDTPVVAYRDDSIIIELERKRMYDSDVFIAYIRIATPNQIRTAIAGSKLKSSSSSSNTVANLASNYNGLVAINGDFYSNSEKSGGYMVRQGQMYRNKYSNNYDILAIDDMGDFHILTRGKENQKNGIKAIESTGEVVNCFFFGPALVIDGVRQTQETFDGYGYAQHDDNPRAGIVQFGPLTYGLVVVNGRTEQSVGVTMDEFAEIVADLGAVQAYNLDGGNSATLVFNGQVFSAKPQDDRGVSDIIYFCSAISEE
ncbi:MAG: phosphodiester glycosidase family protein [Clostridiales bacterium]|nr:phosphodiester glycosidase family protein [Clostridiales bacterium]